jgi:hypothetical protein
VIEGIAGEAICVSNRLNLFEAALWTFVLRNANGAVERNNW